MNLFEINEQIERCTKLNDDTIVDTATGEVIDIEALKAIEMERDQKIENIALWYKNLTSDAEQLDGQMKIFAARKKAAKNKADQLKQYLADVLGGEKFKSAKVAISYRKSEAVIVGDAEKLPEEYLKVVQPEANKAAIKAALKQGEEVAGCSLKANQNIQIK